MLHFGGILAFWASGFGGRVTWPWITLLAANIALMGPIDRAGLVSFGAMMGVCLVLWPRSRVPWRILGLLGGAVLAFWLTGARFQMGYGRSDRPISFETFQNAFLSLVGQSGLESMDANKEWRMAWWKTIIGYTMEGEYFWTGKGYGINLAIDDGFLIGRETESPNRNPHNGHLTVLARGGVPGLALWALAQGLWGVGVFRAYLLSRIAGDRDWLGLFLFLGSYWMAYLICASFDVFLEGPAGGVWFWSIYGAGLAALWIHRHCPEAIRSAAPPLPRPAGPRHVNTTMSY
jgi:hypothetical protein